MTRPTRLTTWPCALVVSLLLAGCNGGLTLPIAQGDPNKPPDPPVDPGPEPPSFAAAIQPTLTTTCAFSGCHGGNRPADGLDLRASAAYASLVNVPSIQVDLMRVLPGDPEASYLVHKLEGTHTVGSLMPDGGPPLSAELIATVRAWIVGGAPNN